MSILFIILFGLNIIQASKDIQRCQKNDFKDEGCSIYLKLNVQKKEILE